MRRNRSVVAACRHPAGSASALTRLFCDVVPRRITSGFLRSAGAATTGFLRAPDRRPGAGSVTAGLAPRHLARHLALLGLRLGWDCVAGQFVATATVEVAPRRPVAIVIMARLRIPRRSRCAGH